MPDHTQDAPAPDQGPVPDAEATIVRVIRLPDAESPEPPRPVGSPAPEEDQPVGSPAPDERQPVSRPVPEEDLPPAPAAPEPATFSWRAVGRDLLKPSASQLVFALILAVVGFVVTVTVQTQVRDDTYANLRRDDLVALLDDLTAQSRSLEAEITTLEETKRQLQSGVDAGQVAREESKKRLDALELLGGTVRAHGPGVRITINDPGGKVTPEIFVNAISELRDAGAEVIELNDGVRVVASTWVTAGDDGLIADGTPLRRPYVIDAIGNPKTLAEATRFRGGLVSSIEGPRVGGAVSVSEVTDVRIDSVVAPRTNRYARPA